MALLRVRLCLICIVAASSVLTGCALVQLEADVRGIDVNPRTRSAMAGWLAPIDQVPAGTLTSLDDPRLSAESGRRGYWMPLQTLREQGANVYLLEPYDAQRTPVLFLHGAAGSAQDWRPWVDALDRSRFQPWVFQYPSGAPVEVTAEWLHRRLAELRARHRFEHLLLTAHSMGGLVTRAFLLQHGLAWPEVRLFVSVSTPWAGDTRAGIAVEHAPLVVPSWHDLQPGGMFMRALFGRRLPAHVRQVLFFGHRGRARPWRSNNDGTVTLASQLRPEAQAEAERVVGFDEDHGSILSARAVLESHRALLEEFDGPPAGGPRRVFR